MSSKRQSTPVASNIGAGSPAAEGSLARQLLGLAKKNAIVSVLGTAFLAALGRALIDQDKDFSEVITVGYILIGVLFVLGIAEALLELVDRVTQDKEKRTDEYVNNQVTLRTMSRAEHNGKIINERVHTNYQMQTIQSHITIEKNINKSVMARTINYLKQCSEEGVEADTKVFEMMLGLMDDNEKEVAKLVYSGELAWEEWVEYYFGFEDIIEKEKTIPNSNAILTEDDVKFAEEVLSSKMDVNTIKEYKKQIKSTTPTSEEIAAQKQFDIIEKAGFDTQLGNDEKEEEDQKPS